MIQSFHQDQSAPFQSSPLLANPVLFLDPWPATTSTKSTTTDSLETAAAVGVTLIRFVLLIRQLDPDFGSQCTHHFALQMAAAVRVGATYLKI